MLNFKMATMHLFLKDYLKFLSQYLILGQRLSILVRINTLHFPSLNEAIKPKQNACHIYFKALKSE